MKFNVCVIRPGGYIHSAAFSELAELLGYGLADLGHETTIATNEILPDARNIVIGCHLLDHSVIPHVPPATIVLNTEQICGDEHPWGTRIFEWTTRFETWDYSARNMVTHAQVGSKNPKLLRIGYHKRLERISRAENQDIDILFYGMFGDRREKIFEQLRSGGCRLTTVHGVFGTERDALVARAKVVLNVHHYTTQVFEVVRAFYLMTNAKAVVSEVNAGTSIAPEYLDGIHAAPTEGLLEACRRLVADAGLRAEAEEKALATIRKLPQHELLAPLIG